jgi:RNA-dependent RNA polymerase
MLAPDTTMAPSKSPRRGSKAATTRNQTSPMLVKHGIRAGDRIITSDSSNDGFPTRQLTKAHAPARRFIIEAPSSVKPNASSAFRGMSGENHHRSSTGLRELQQPQRPLLRPKEPWQTWQELTIRVANLPPTVTTWNLWERFQREGTVVFIEIFDDRQGRRDGNAKIRFAPPPHRAFWTLDNVTLSTSDGQGAFQVKVYPESKKRRFEVQSPIRKHIWYPEAIILHPKSLAFGFMHGPNTIMEMHNATSLSRSGTIFKVDLLRNRIIVTFEVSLTDPETRLQSTNGPPRSGELDRINRYMFTIPFGQLEKLDRIQLSGNQWALVVSLDSPPQFFRKRLDPTASHSKEALTWSEFDTWYRQTDIVYDPRRLVNAVVSLKKERPVIDIG